ncbi:reverse transcriptase domain-containing protein [Tanacetum coccineum]
MPFGLRNARATYQRLVDKAFHKKILQKPSKYRVDGPCYQKPHEDEIAEKSFTFFKNLKNCTRKSDFIGLQKRKIGSANEEIIAELPMILLLAGALRGPEVNYTSMEKLCGFVLAVKRLKKVYFQTHPIIVITDQLIQQTQSIDGSSCTDGSEAGLILTNPEGMEFTYALRFRFDATNNEAEYEALIARLKFTEQMGVKNLQVNVDSRLVANEVNETYVAKETDMVRYLEKVKTLTTSFKAFSIKQVPRSKNKKADALSKIASTSFAYVSKQVLVEELKEKSISAVEVLAVVEEEGRRP